MLLRRWHETNLSNQYRVLSVLLKWFKGRDCFEYLKNRYTPAHVKSLKKLVDYNGRIGAERTKIKFYLDCQRECRFPRHFAKDLRKAKMRPNHVNLMWLLKSHINECKEHLNDLLDRQRPFQASIVRTCLSVYCISLIYLLL